MGGDPQHSPYGPRSLEPVNVRLQEYELAGAQDSAPGDSALSGPPQESVSDDQIGHTFPGFVLPGLGDSLDVTPTQDPDSSSAFDRLTQIPQGDSNRVVPLSKGLPRNRKRTR